MNTEIFDNLIEVKEPVKATDLPDFSYLYIMVLPEKKEGRGKKVYNAIALVKNADGIVETDVTFGPKEYTSFEKSPYQMVRNGVLVPLKSAITVL